MTVVFCTVIGAQQYSEMHGTFSTNSCIAEFADEFVDESVRKSTKSTNSTCASCAWCRLLELSVTSRLPQTSCFSQGMGVVSRHQTVPLYPGLCQLLTAIIADTLKDLLGDTSTSGQSMTPIDLEQVSWKLVPTCCRRI